jgi:hypothetical protein
MRAFLASTRHTAAATVRTVRITILGSAAAGGDEVSRRSRETERRERVREFQEQQKAVDAGATFLEHINDDGARIVSHAWSDRLGDDCALEVPDQRVPQLLDGLEHVRLLEPSPEILRSVSELCAELTAPPNETNAILREHRSIRIRRTVDRTTYELPKVLGCDVPRVLALFAAIVLGSPELVPTHYQLLRQSGIPLGVTLRGNMLTVSLFGETLTFGFATVN